MRPFLARLLQSKRMPPYDPENHTGRLSRLPAGFYLGHTFVHWIMNLRPGAAGWLTPSHHAETRELVCHALVRCRLLCPAYCLMPDHGHFLFIGWHPQSDQLKGVKAFRSEWGQLLARSGGPVLEKQSYDNVLRDRDRIHAALPATAQYVLSNPQTAGLVDSWPHYPYAGAVVPGFARMDPRETDYWERFWRVYNWIVEKRDKDL